MGDTLRIEGKGGKARLTPIHPALGEVLQHHSGPGPLLYGPHGLPIKESRVYTLTKQWAGDYTPHDFRRTLATSLAENGVVDAIIEKMLGWAPRSVMGRFYRRVSDDECQRAILAAYANDPL